MSRRDRKPNYSQHNGGIHKKVNDSDRRSIFDNSFTINSISAEQNPPMTEVTNQLNIDPSLLTHLVQITDKMKVDLQQVNSRMNVLEQKVISSSYYSSPLLCNFSSPSRLALVRNKKLKLNRLTGVLSPSHSHHYHFHSIFLSLAVPLD